MIRTASLPHSPRLHVQDLGDQVVHLLLSTRFTRLMGMDTSAYLVGRLLIDSGFAHARRPLMDYLAGRPVERLACTHAHEDHTGNAGVVARSHACPVFLRRADEIWEEGVGKLLPYRLLFWGTPAPVQPVEMPGRFDESGHELEAIPAPGHARTLTCLFDRTSGWLYAGDLVVSPGVTAVLSYENPYEHIASLRKMAALEPERMLTGHGMDVKKPARLLSRKAERIEQAAVRARELHRRGWALSRIAADLFPGERFRDGFHLMLTSGEFSQINFVRACIDKAPA